MIYFLKGKDKKERNRQLKGKQIYRTEQHNTLEPLLKIESENQKIMQIEKNNLPF